MTIRKLTMDEARAMDPIAPTTPRRRGRAPNLSPDEVTERLRAVGSHLTGAEPEVEPTVEAVPVDGGPKKKRKKSTSKKRVLEKLIDDSLEHIRSGSWEGAKPSILVGVYARGHYLTYGELMPTELEKEPEFLGACSAAAKVVRQLGDSVPRAYAFVKWSWERERERLAKNPERVFRMGWRIQFSSSLVNDYLAASNRKPGRRRG